MAINVSAWSIRKPVPSIVLFVVLMLLGIVAFQILPVTRFPNIDIPLVAVTVVQSGSAPSELETQVTREVEDAVANIPGVKHVMSTVDDGRSVTTVEFRLEADPSEALADVKDAVDKIRADLPGDAEEPIVEKIDVERQSIRTYAASSPGMTLEQLSWFVDDVVVRKLQGLAGVGQVDRYGGVDREIAVALDPARLMALGITAASVSQQLRATNVDLAGGRGEVGGQEQSIRTLAGARTVADLAETTIVLGDGREVRLADLGTVSDGYEEPRTFARLDGATPVVAFSVFRAKGASDVDVAAVAEAAIAALAAEHPDVAYSLIDDSVEATKGNYDSAMMTLFEGAVLAIIVVFVFLRDWRATLVAATALPLSVVPTFWVMDLMGFSLNLVSLLGITLVTGILVDDAIVEIENIVRHMRMGKSPFRAAMEAADEIGLAVIAISMTIVAVFAPVSFMSGIAGQYFKQFGLTVAVAVLFSLAVARLITPMMAAYLMRNHKGQVAARDGWLMRRYTAFLALTIRWRFLTLLAGIAIFAVSILSAGLLPTGFMPAEDTSRIVLSVELPPGARLDDGREKSDEVVAILAEIPEIDQVFVLGGTSPSGQLELRKAAVYVRLLPKAERDRTQQQVEAAITDRLAGVPDVRAWYVNDMGERQLSVSLLSNDPAALDAAVARLEAAVRRAPGFFNVAANAGVERPEILIRPRLEEAARFGIAPEQISAAVRVATIGDVDAALPKFNTGDRLIPIRVQFDIRARGDLALVKALPITGATGRVAPLEAVADVGFGRGPSSIERYDRERRAVIGADLARGLELGPALETLFALPEATALPEGVRLQSTGDAEIMGEVFSGFAMAMAAGLMMVLGVLVLLFGSVFQPITILLSLPLSIGGVIAALLATNNAVSMPVVIGVLMLMGIVTKNAIMLVDFAIESGHRGVPRVEAIIDAGRKRARPIIMTTIAMAAGMLPSALGLGDGGEFRAPMAIAVIGGLLVSTVLSLVFVPSFYTVMDDCARVCARLLGRFVGPREDGERGGNAATRPSPATTPGAVRHAAE